MAARPKAYSYLRMSTDAQLKGDSRRRQLEASKKYADENGLELVGTTQLEDIGVSAFTGANMKEGALGGFVRALQGGMIEKGSYLLVESLDRISRQEPRKSLEIFITILNAGINIVTLVDKRLYLAEKIDEFELMASLLFMGRAHDESRHKSHRIGQAWANKRKNAHESPLTEKCPAWLELPKGGKKFRVIESRANIVHSMFEDAVSGIGSYTITRRLNEKCVPPFGQRSNGWQTSYVSKILCNRAVLGEFQPHKKIDGKRRPDGEAIKGYFPTIIDEPLFYRAQAARAARKLNGSGRKGNDFSNLFSRVAKCAYCRSTMAFENKGLGPKGGSFLVCDRAKRGLGCSATRWRYSDFEKSFLAFVQELDLERLVRHRDDANAEAELNAKIDAIRGELTETKERMTRLCDLYEQGHGATTFVADRLNALEVRCGELENELKRKQDELVTLTNGPRVDDTDQIKAHISRVQRREGQELFKLRAQIASTIKNIISTLLVAPIGDAPLTLRAQEALAKQHLDAQIRDPLVDDVINYMKVTASDPRSHRRYFVIGFTNHTMRAVYPSDQDPLEYEEQLLSNSEGLMRISKSGQTITLFD